MVLALGRVVCVAGLIIKLGVGLGFGLVGVVCCGAIGGVGVVVAAAAAAAAVAALATAAAAIISTPLCRPRWRRRGRARGPSFAPMSPFLLLSFFRTTTGSSSRSRRYSTNSFFHASYAIHRR